MIDKLPSHSIPSKSTSKVLTPKAPKVSRPQRSDVDKTLADSVIDNVDFKPNENNDELRVKLIFDTLTKAWGDNIANESEFRLLVEKINNTLKDSAFIEEQLTVLSKELTATKLKKP